MDVTIVTVLLEHRGACYQCCFEVEPEGSTIRNWMRLNKAAKPPERKRFLFESSVPAEVVTRAIDAQREEERRNF